MLDAHYSVAQEIHEQVPFVAACFCFFGKDGNEEGNLYGSTKASGASKVINGVISVMQERRFVDWFLGPKKWSVRCS